MPQKSPVTPPRSQRCSGAEPRSQRPTSRHQVQGLLWHAQFRQTGVEGGGSPHSLPCSSPLFPSPSSRTTPVSRAGQDRALLLTMAILLAPPLAPEPQAQNPSSEHSCGGWVISGVQEGPRFCFRVSLEPPAHCGPCWSRGSQETALATTPPHARARLSQVGVCMKWQMCFSQSPAVSPPSAEGYRFQH